MNVDFQKIFNNYSIKKNFIKIFDPIVIVGLYKPGFGAPKAPEPFCNKGTKCLAITKGPAALIAYKAWRSSNFTSDSLVSPTKLDQTLFKVAFEFSFL